MGLSIHYSGAIRNMILLDELMTETSDICESLGWKYHLLDGHNDDKLKGIILSPEKSEPIMFTFLPDGRLCSFVNLMHKDMYDGVQFDKELMYTSSTKTQFAGYDAHIAIIKLLRYLKDKYFSSFHLQDEGLYWETNDEKVLQEQFTRYSIALKTVSEVLSGMQKIPDESADSLADRIEKVLREKLGGQGNQLSNE